MCLIIACWLTKSFTKLFFYYESSKIPYTVFMFPIILFHSIGNKDDGVKGLTCAQINNKQTNYTLISWYSTLWWRSPSLSEIRIDVDKLWGEKDNGKRQIFVNDLAEIHHVFCLQNGEASCSFSGKSARNILRNLLYFVSQCSSTEMRR